MFKQIGPIYQIYFIKFKFISSNLNLFHRIGQTFGGSSNFCASVLAKVWRSNAHECNEEQNTTFPERRNNRRWNENITTEQFRENNW